MTRREALKAAAASAGVLVGNGCSWAQGQARGTQRQPQLLEALSQISPRALKFAGLENVPALPIDVPEVLESIPKLLHRLLEQEPAKAGLSNEYTIGGQTATGREFLFGPSLHGRLDEALQDLQITLRGDPAAFIDYLRGSIFAPGGPFDLMRSRTELTELALESPQQWAISWTNFEGVYDRALPTLPRWSATMTDIDVAEEEFWPTIATYGVAYNLLILRKLSTDNFEDYRAALGHAWTEDCFRLLNDGLLYVIDMSIFESLRSNVVDGFERFTPATITLLEQNPQTKLLRPIAIRVAAESGAGVQVYTRNTATASAWLYAMLAAKTSVTVYGIWLGHVYQWHVITAAMIMTMKNALPRSHPVRELLAPQSDYLIGFDDILLMVWRHIAPPTSVSTPLQFLRLLDKFAERRDFALDNPRQALADLGLEVADFSSHTDLPWDRYPIVGYFLEIWDAAEAYVTSVVNESYRTDREVSADRSLQSWIRNSGKATGGNVKGLPKLDGKAALIELLTSLIWRITVHGIARLSNTANPAMTFVPNFPPCLQNSTIPPPAAQFDTGTLLSYLPRTGTIGLMVTFYFTFAFSAPYVPFIPQEGLEAELYFPGGGADPRNQALIEFRRRLHSFISKYQAEGPQYHQWPRNIET